MLTCLTFIPWEGIGLSVTRERVLVAIWLREGAFLASLATPYAVVHTPLDDPQNECGTPSTTIHVVHTTKWTPSGTPPQRVCMPIVLQWLKSSSGG